MHTYFGEWYREALFEPTAELLNNRWAGISQFVDACDDPNEATAELIRLLYSLPSRNDSFILAYRKRFQEFDAAFKMRGNDVELAVLAGATLVHLLDQQDDQFSEFSAIAIACADCQGLRHPVISDVPTMARNFLRERSISLRQPKESPQVKMQGIKTQELLQSFRSAAQGNQISSLAEPVVELFNHVFTTFAELEISANKAVVDLTESLQLQQEETDILWWLLGESSRDSNTPFCEMALPAACLITGKELADLTKVLPGPLAIEAFLDRMLHTGNRSLPTTVSLKDSINAVSKQWKENLVTDYVAKVNDLCPIHFAAMKASETGGDIEWIPAFEKGSGFSAEALISPVALSVQCYVERLFFRATEENGENDG